MDVDTPHNEEAMETDPPQLTRKESIIDPDGDAVMDADADAEGGEVEEEGMYEDDVEVQDGDGDVDVDVEITEVEGEAEGEGELIEAEVEGDRDITPIEPDAQEEGDYEEAQAELEVEEVGETDGIAPLDTADAVVEGSTDHAPTIVPATTVEPITGDENENENENENEAEPEIHAEELLSDQATKPEFTDETHDDQPDPELEEEHEQEEEYESLTPQTLPPILLHLPHPHGQRALFNPFALEDGTDVPLWFAEKVAEYCESPLAHFLSEIRGRLDFEGSGAGNEGDEMVVVEKLMDLKMGDVSPLSTCSPFSEYPRKSK
jgi:hypothetical protein